MLEPMDPMQRHIEVLIRMEDAEIEKVCEQALQGGEHGVKIIKAWPGRLVSVEVSEDVPYGMIRADILSAQVDI